MLKQIFLAFVQNYRKLLPVLVLFVLLFLAGGTDVFSQGVHLALREAIVDYFHKLMPFLIELIIAGIMINVAWLFYKPSCTALEKMLERGHASERGRMLSMKLFKFFYWAVAVFVVLGFTAAEFLGRFVIGFGVFGAALTLSLQGAANDFICGLLIQVTRKLTEGDDISLEGLAVEGKVVAVGYLSTNIDSEANCIRVPNREIWSRAVKVKKPAKSSILLPPGVECTCAASNGESK